MAMKVLTALCIVAAIVCVTSSAATKHAEKFPGDSSLVTFRATSKVFGRHLLGLACQYDPTSTPCSAPFLPYCCETTENDDGSSCVQLSANDAAECATDVPNPACCIST